MPGSPARSLLSLRRRPPPARNLPTRAARLGQPDRDRLLAALHLLPGPPALQRPALPLVHRLLDLLLGLAAVLRHGVYRHARPPACVVPARARRFLHMKRMGSVVVSSRAREPHPVRWPIRAARYEARRRR